MLELSDYSTRVVPLPLHGDGVPISGVGKKWQKSMTFYTWASMVGSGTTKEIMFYIFSVFGHLQCNKPEAHTTKSLWKVMAWSLSWLAKGLWPDRDWNNKLYPKNSPEGQLAKTPLAAGLCGYIWACKGDLDYFLKETAKIATLMLYCLLYTSDAADDM
eukprot:10894263-Alexandrium_andersonii.AAC.1